LMSISTIVVALNAQLLRRLHLGFEQAETLSKESPHYSVTPAISSNARK
jgi:hypothetical protein